ncbi:MAG: hypothetical protein HZB55_06065 [Deltaproteobacteria bacterium]|nr:hypothetical protein [Deltaproteobacteria bacterium]
MFRAMDRSLRALCADPDPEAPPEPRRLLLANPAHLGDVLASTAVLPVLKSAFPNTSVGMLVGSWSVPLVANHPLVDQVHLFDHWYANRGSDAFPVKLRRHWLTRATALAEIRAVGYDTAVDLYCHSPPPKVGA